jgi:perosamine synthetase
MKDRINQIKIASTATIREALQCIDNNTLGFALLVDQDTDRFEGLVTDGDIRRALIDGIELESSVSHVSRPDPIYANTGMSVKEISGLLEDDIRVVPVLDVDEKVVDLAIFDKRAYLPVAEPQFGDSELRYVSECILAGWVSSGGKFVKKFEDCFAEFCETRFAVTTANGTAALHLSMLALEIGPGDEVIIPSLTFISTANAVTYTGAKPTFVDSEPYTWNIDPDGIKKAITSRTKAIIPVHLYGHPADMAPILEIANKYGLAVVEDAAEAHGALCNGKKVGSLGEIGIFSFFGNKTITTGEGGMIVTDDQKLAEKLCILRDHGMDKKRRYWHPVLGYNYRMTNIQAALGVAQMERIDQIIEKKRRNAAAFNKELQDIPGIILPPDAAWARNIYWMYSILVDEEKFKISSKELGERLKERDIETRSLFTPVHQQPIYNTGQSLPVSERLSRCGLSLPSSVNLKGNEIERITREIRNIQQKCN